jgi:hypothetical protein
LLARIQLKEVKQQVENLPGEASRLLRGVKNLLKENNLKSKSLKKIAKLQTPNLQKSK